MNTKSIILIALFSSVLFVGYLGLMGLNTRQEKSKRESNSSTMPKFTFYQAVNQTYCRSDLASNRATVIIYFHPECDHCQYQIDQLTQNSKDFKDSKVLFVSNYPSHDLIEFYEDYNICTLNDAELLWDRDHEFSKYFGEATFPTTIIYGPDKMLKKKILGEVKIENILKHL